MKFSWSTTSLPGGNDDGQNQAFFASTVYGQTFGGALAITLIHYSGTTMSEADTIFNSALKWDSYRGTLQYDYTTGQYTYDLHRVALHEFGHTLGLDHPDEAGQTVTALMNARISDLDQLQSDDIAGAQSLYTHPSVNATLANQFTYTIRTANSPTSFAATNLPADLHLNSTTGQITGVVTLSGPIDIQISASGSGSTVNYTLRIQTTIPHPPLGSLMTSWNLRATHFATDPPRHRIYASLPDSSSVAVFDTQALNLVNTVPLGSAPEGLSVSPNGSILWIAKPGTASSIRGIDLNTFKTVSIIPIQGEEAYNVYEGLNHRLYIATYQQVHQIDGQTGAEQGTFGFGPLLQISADRRTLFIGTIGISPSELAKYDVTTASPTLIQEAPFGSIGSNGVDLKLSHRGDFIIFPNATGNNPDVPYTTRLIPTIDLAGSYGEVSVDYYPAAVAISGDDTTVYQGHTFNGKIVAFDTTSLSTYGSINLGYDVKDLALDSTGSKLFIATTYSYPEQGDIRVYNTGQTNYPTPAPVTTPKTLANVSTRLSVGTADQVEIGGFIIRGFASKKVVVRALGPTLNRIGVAGALLDPVLELHDGTGTVVASNDNWNSHRTDVIATGLAPPDEHESVIITTLVPGNYTAVLRGVQNTTGVALFELYDVDPLNSKIANISTRGHVGTDDSVMIGGFIIAGDQATNVIVRALGPTLTEFGVTGALANPALELHDGNGATIAQNDDWKSDQQAAIQNSGYAPPKDAEAAILATLQPGNYTAIVRGAQNTTGVGLVEVYNLDAN